MRREYSIEEVNALVRVLEARGDVYAQDAVGVIMQLRGELVDRQAAFMLVDECRDCGEDRPEFCKECELSHFAEEEHEKTGDAHLNMLAAFDLEERYNDYLLQLGRRLVPGDDLIIKKMTDVFLEATRDNAILRHAYLEKCAEIAGAV